MAQTVIVNGGGANINREVVISKDPINSRTIVVDEGGTNAAAITHQRLQAEIDAEIARATGAEEALNHTKQDLGYITLDSYLLNPDCGIITDPTAMARLNSYLVNKVSLSANIYYLTLSDNSTLIYFCASRIATFNQLTLNRLTGQFQLEKIPVGHTDHNKLNNLDYLSSGHTGFAGILFGTTAYWNSRRDYKPPLGMLIIYTDYAVDATGTAVPGIKIGDGNSYLIDQAFIGQNLSDILAAHLDDMTRHITQEEREKWNNKLNLVEPAGDEDLLVFNRN